MKKMALILILLSLLAACSSKKDPLAQFQGMSAQQIYESANKNMKNENFATAIEQFEALDNLYPFGTYTEQAQLDLIYVYYKDEDMPSALAATERYIHLYPRSQYVDYAYYMKGLVAYKDGLTWMQQFFNVSPAARNIQHLQDAYYSFDQLVQRFPNSVYRDDALAHMAYVRNQLAEQELRVANFYMYHKAYVAAINRATNIILNYPQSPTVLDAIALNVKAYRLLNQPELANRYLELLQVNFPNSRQYRKLSS